MEGGSLFKSGFLGADFSWWVGQIADDSESRDNIIPGKHPSVGQNVGWGRRYKVRIIGFHDQKEEVVKSSQLPWAQLMYPVTAGGGQRASIQTDNLQQGMFVFGFFLDVDDQQTPVIMGVLGNNAQTSLKNKIGTTESNFGPTSGYAAGVKPKTGTAAENDNPAPDDDKAVEKKPLNSTDDSDGHDECTPPNDPKVKLNKYGLRPDRTLTRQQLSDAQSARTKGKNDGLTGPDLEDFVMKSVSDKIKARCNAKKGPNTPPESGATSENVDDVNLEKANDPKKNDQYLRKIPVENPYDVINSSMTSMQLVLDNLMNEINSVLNTAESYIDMVSSVSNASICDTIDALIATAASEMSKYMKPIYEKIQEYLTKKIQTSMDPAVNILFPNQRNMIADMKQQATELMVCLFEKIIAKLKDQLLSALTSSMGQIAGCNGADGSSGGSSGGSSSNTGGHRGEPIDQNTPTPSNKVPHVPICYVENLVGDLIASNKIDIEEAVGKITTNVDDFLKNQSNELDSIQMILNAGSGGAAGDSLDKVSSLIDGARDTLSSMGGISGDIASAMNFVNMSFEIFGCNVSPLESAAQFYTFQNGGGSGEQSDTPRPGETSKTASSGDAEVGTEPEKQYALPNAEATDTPPEASTTTKAPKAKVGDMASPEDRRLIQEEQKIGTTMKEKSELKSTGQRSKQETENIKKDLELF